MYSNSYYKHNNELDLGSLMELADSMELMTAKEVARYTGLPVGTLRYWRSAGLGPASFTLGRRIVYRRAAVEAWILAQESATARGGSDAPCSA